MPLWSKKSCPECSSLFPLHFSFKFSFQREERINPDNNNGESLMALIKVNVWFFNCATWNSIFRPKMHLKALGPFVTNTLSQVILICYVGWKTGRLLYVICSISSFNFFYNSWAFTAPKKKKKSNSSFDLQISARGYSTLGF